MNSASTIHTIQQPGLLLNYGRLVTKSAHMALTTQTHMSVQMSSLHTRPPLNWWATPIRESGKCTHRPDRVVRIGDGEGVVNGVEDGGGLSTGVGAMSRWARFRQSKETLSVCPLRYVKCLSALVSTLNGSSYGSCRGVRTASLQAKTWVQALLTCVLCLVLNRSSFEFLHCWLELSE